MSVEKQRYYAKSCKGNDPMKQYLLSKFPQKASEMIEILIIATDHQFLEYLSGR